MVQVAALIRSSTSAKLPGRINPITNFSGGVYELYSHRGLIHTRNYSYNQCMTEISRDDVQHLAQLSSLLLSDNEIDALRTDIEDILKYIEQLSELNTEGVEPTYQVTELENVWRDDTVIDDGIAREDLLALSEEQKDNQVKVPKVLTW